MRRMLLRAALAAVIAVAVLPAAAQEPAITEEEARAIGVDAYRYLYPLVTMEVTRRQFTNVEPGKEFGRQRASDGRRPGGKQP